MTTGWSSTADAPDPTLTKANVHESSYGGADSKREENDASRDDCQDFCSIVCPQPAEN